MPDLVPVDTDPFNVNLTPVEGNPFAPDQIAPPSPLQSQVSGFPQRAADLTISALGPLGEAGMTVGDWLRTGGSSFDTRDIAPVAAGVMLGTASPEAEEGAAAAEGAQAVAKGIRAFHGSPYDFDKFDLSKIGTGEGAQAYGHGLYFAENPAVAQSYDPRPEAGSAAAGIGLREKTPGKMYEVNIAADPEHFLDWDKPLSEQSPQVQKALEQFGYKHDPQQAKTYDSALLDALTNNGSTDLPPQPRNPTGADIYSKMPIPDRTPATVTDRLRQAGIPGIRYLDQGSRNAGQGTHNYVVFSPDVINVIRKYGIAALIAGGAAHFSTSPVEHNPFSD